jgi:uncharacterized membrane protein
MNHGWNGGWAMGGHALGFPWGGLAMGILFLALIALIVVAIVRMGKSSATSFEVAKDRGIDILIERYTRGEIDADTFRAMKAVLDAKN